MSSSILCGGEYSWEEGNPPDGCSEAHRAIYPPFDPQLTMYSVVLPFDHTALGIRFDSVAAPNRYIICVDEGSLEVHGGEWITIGVCDSIRPCSRRPPSTVWLETHTQTTTSVFDVNYILYIIREPPFLANYTQCPSNCSHGQQTSHGEDIASVCIRDSANVSTTPFCYCDVESANLTTCEASVPSPPPYQPPTPRTDSNDSLTATLIVVVVLLVAAVIIGGMWLRKYRRLRRLTRAQPLEILEPFKVDDVDSAELAMVPVHLQEPSLCNGVERGDVEGSVPTHFQDLEHDKSHICHVEEDSEFLGA